jgi:transcriptional regulator with XRE-family HTH domain
MTKIRERRLQMGLTITDVAKRVECSRPNMSRIDSGKSMPTAEMAVKLEYAIFLPRWIMRPDIFVVDYVEGGRE